jgi:ferric-dicitrate binding protein FerR (iron transport regulator)
MSGPADETRYARLAARALQAEEASAASSSLGDRAADVAAIARALRARGRARTRPVLLVAAAAAAVAAAVVLGIGRDGARRDPVAGAERVVPRQLVTTDPLSRLSVLALEGAGASVEQGGVVKPAALQDQVTAGARLEVPADGRLTLALATGTRLALAGASSTRVVELDAMQRFDLERGALAAQVAKLGVGRRFVVATPDAEVEVRGTRFAVAVGEAAAGSCDPAVRTRVTVDEGVVVVRHGSSEARVAAGSHWPDCGPATAPPPATPARAHRSGAVSARPAVAAAPAPAADDAATAAEALRASTLAEQNDLFAAALAAGRRGDLQEARHWLDQLIDRYPNGQLVDSARAERARLMRQAAAGAAREPSE